MIALFAFNSTVVDGHDPLLSLTEIGKAIQQVMGTEAETQEYVSSSYLSDFVNMTYQTRSGEPEIEHQVKIWLDKL